MCACWGVGRRISLFKNASRYMKWSIEYVINRQKE